MPNAENQFAPTRRSLISRLKRAGDDDSWQQFFDCYGKLIFITAMKAGLGHDEAEDVVQETIMSLTKNITGFEYAPGRGSFKNWLLRLTRWRIVDQFRKRPSVRQTLPGTDEDRIESIIDPNDLDPAQIWDQEWQNNILELALEEVKGRVDPKMFQLFDLSEIKNWPLSRITKTLKVSAARVYLARHRVKILLRQEVKALRIKLDLAEIASWGRKPRDAG